MREGQQLVALAGLHELLHGHAIDYWLFGGWAVDFHVGQVTRSHDDLDLAVLVACEERQLESDPAAHVARVAVLARLRRMVPTFGAE